MGCARASRAGCISVRPYFAVWGEGHAERGARGTPAPSDCGLHPGEIKLTRKYYKIRRIMSVHGEIPVLKNIAKLRNRVAETVIISERWEPCTRALILQHASQVCY